MSKLVVEKAINGWIVKYNKETHVFTNDEKPEVSKEIGDIISEMDSQTTLDVVSKE